MDAFFERLESRRLFAGSFTDTAVLGGLDSPVAVRVAGDGRVFVAERRGIIKVFDSFEDKTATVFADLRAHVHNYHDRGLLGLTLDPKFTAGRPYVYVLATYDGLIDGDSPLYGSETSNTDPGPNVNGQGTPASGMLARLTADGDVMKPDSEKVLIHDWPQQFTTHSVGNVAFGPDGYLYVSAGDAASYHKVDYGQYGNPFNDPANEGGALRSQDVLSPADPTQLDGTVLRLNPDTGLAAPGNPFATSSDLNRRRVIAWGLRNPFRFTFRPGSKELWLGDVGWEGYEEINRIASVSDTKTENFGWPAYEGPKPQSGYQNADLDLLKPLYGNPSLVTQPYYSYKHTDQVVPGSGEPVGGSSVTGLAFYSTGNYPKEYQGAMFFADYSRKRIYVMPRGADGLPDVSKRAVFRTTSRGAVQLFTAANGDLMYVDLNGGSVRRITYTQDAANRAPVAVIRSDKTTGLAPLTINFNATASTDPDGDALIYAWDLDGDGTYDDSAAAAPAYRYTKAGEVTVGLRVTDAKGASATTSLVVRPGDTPPTVSISTPTTSTKWAVGDTVSFSATATDTQDGTLPAKSFEWKLELLHDNLLDPDSAHIHVLRSFTGVRNGTFVAPDHEYPSRLRLSVTVTDSGGATTVRSVILQPKTARLQLASQPAGIVLSVSGASFAAPKRLTTIANADESVSAPQQTVIDGKTWYFSSWSDGGGQSHEVTMSADRVLIARYTSTPPSTLAHFGPSSLASTTVPASTPFGAMIEPLAPARADEVPPTPSMSVFTPRPGVVFAFPIQPLDRWTTTFFAA